METEQEAKVVICYKNRKMYLPGVGGRYIKNYGELRDLLRQGYRFRFIDAYSQKDRTQEKLRHCVISLNHELLKTAPEEQLYKLVIHGI